MATAFGVWFYSHGITHNRDESAMLNQSTLLGKGLTTGLIAAGMAGTIFAGTSLADGPTIASEAIHIPNANRVRGKDFNCQSMMILHDDFSGRTAASTDIRLRHNNTLSGDTTLFEATGNVNDPQRNLILSNVQTGTCHFDAQEGGNADNTWTYTINAYS